MQAKQRSAHHLFLRSTATHSPPKTYTHRVQHHEEELHSSSSSRTPRSAPTRASRAAQAGHQRGRQARSSRECIIILLELSLTKWVVGSLNGLQREGTGAVAHRPRCAWKEKVTQRRRSRRERQCHPIPPSLVSWAGSGRSGLVLDTNSKAAPLVRSILARDHAVKKVDGSIDNGRRRRSMLKLGRTLVDLGDLRRVLKRKETYSESDSSPSPPGLAGGPGWSGLERAGLGPFLCQVCKFEKSGTL